MVLMWQLQPTMVSLRRGLLLLVAMRLWQNCCWTMVQMWQALSLTFGYRLSRSLRRVTLPRSMRTLAFGHDDEFAQRLEGVALSRGV